MIDYLNISAVPLDENCAQIGTDNYVSQSRKECNAFARQLTRVFGEAPLEARIVVRDFAHDFGSYKEVCVAYNDNCEIAEDFAFNIENNIPLTWDKEARAEIGLVEA